jgi:hypothetical protein
MVISYVFLLEAEPKHSPSRVMQIIKKHYSRVNADNLSTPNSLVKGSIIQSIELAFHDFQDNSGKHIFQASPCKYVFGLSMDSIVIAVNQ